MTPTQTPQQDLPRTDTPAKTVKVYIENRRKKDRGRPVKRVKCVQVVDFYREGAC
jgi:hypothetical protein